MREANSSPPAVQLEPPAAPAVASLWIGDRLPVMQLLSIQSFLAQGHPYHLYVYDAIENAPAGATVLDAGQILPRDKVFRHSAAAGGGVGSYAAFADFFRYQLLLEKGGYWVDTDIVCVKPFNFPDEFVIASERDKRGRIRPTTCVLRSPQGSPFFEFCVRICSAKQPERLQWCEIGPYLVQEAVAKFQLERFVWPADTFCPVDWFAFRALFLAAAPPFPAAAHAVHLWNEAWRRNGLDPAGNYHPECLYEQLKRRFMPRCLADETRR